MIWLWICTHCFFFSYYMIWRKYDAHGVWLYFYMFHICHFYFPWTLYFEHFGWDPWVFLNKNHAMKLIMYLYFGRYATLATTHDLVSWRFLKNCGGNTERNVELLIMILFSASLASLSTPLYLSLTRLLWSSLTDTCSNNFGTSCGSVWP